jgi:hypothetical protein
LEIKTALGRKENIDSKKMATKQEHGIARKKKRKWFQ